MKHNIHKTDIILYYWILVYWSIHNTHHPNLHYLINLGKVDQKQLSPNIMSTKI